MVHGRIRAGPHPSGFKKLITSVNKFSGEKASNNFEVWLDDFLEAMGDCGWRYPDIARWFSWFLTRVVKESWQHSLKSEDKLSWDTNVVVFKGEYGVPHTAYQCCHELRYMYDQFGVCWLQ